MMQSEVGCLDLFCSNAEFFSARPTLNYLGGFMAEPVMEAVRYFGANQS